MNDLKICIKCKKQLDNDKFYNTGNKCKICVRGYNYIRSNSLFFLFEIPWNYALNIVEIYKKGKEELRKKTNRKEANKVWKEERKKNKQKYEKNYLECRK